jgi:methanethiol S-methyltransferase
MSNRRHADGVDNRAMRRFLTIGYGAGAYALFLTAFVYALGFVGDIGVPRSVDHGVAAPNESVLTPARHPMSATR